MVSQFDVLEHWNFQGLVTEKIINVAMTFPPGAFSSGAKFQARNDMLKKVLVRCGIKVSSKDPLGLRHGLQLFNGLAEDVMRVLIGGEVNGGEKFPSNPDRTGSPTSSFARPRGTHRKLCFDQSDGTP